MLDGNTCSARDLRLPSGVVGAVQGMSYQVELLGGNSLLDPETLICIVGIAGIAGIAAKFSKSC
ncbi:MAG: hypothetical protein OXP09_03225 [Gammaproteobacteria bacterium]|nr:hypothetical protein [Gammaproteobacteria bacterium]